MNHMIICREYPPAPYPPGGIGTYVRHMARELAEAGETVHVIAQRWEGAPLKTSESFGGRLVVHRVSLDERADPSGPSVAGDSVLHGLVVSDCPSQAFSWQVAHLAEYLVRSEMIDLIEAPEWEAPLYYFQVRRALGLGPRREPPCLIHLHSPSELIFRHNQWDLTLTDFPPLRRFEEYTVRAADALVCPSHYLARDAQRLFALQPDDIHVIPYPMGDTPVLDRTADVWKRDSICYAGRLELRKGVVEWVDAAVQVATTHPAVTFEFIGSDGSLTGGAGRSVREHLNDRIPRQLRARFRFHGSQGRRELLQSLAAAPVAVVPSRWENLPYSCIEAMCTGLPVLASPKGGMAELVTDGRSGWLAEDATASAFAATLRRVIETPASERAAMGREAANAVRRICANQSVLRRHLELRARLVAAGPGRSRHVPVSPCGRARDTTSNGAPPISERSGIGVVVTCLEHPELLSDCLASIERQSRTAKMVVVVANEALKLEVEPIHRRCPVDWRFLYVPAASSSGAKTLGATQLFSAAPLVGGVVFGRETARLAPRYIETVETVFTARPGIGVISSFVRYGSILDAAPPPAPVCGLDFDDGLQCVALRSEALLAQGRLGGAPNDEVSPFSDGDDWAAVTYPDSLVSVEGKHVTAHVDGRKKRYSAMALAQCGCARTTLTWFMAAPFAEKGRWIQRVLTRPRHTAQWLAWQIRTAANRGV